MSESQRPRVRIEIHEPYHVQCDLSWQALVAANDDTDLCVRGETLVRMGEHELVEFDVPALQERLSQVAKFVTVKEKDGDLIDVEVKPPRDVCQSLVARTGRQYAGVPQIDKVVDVPVLDKNRDFVSVPGAEPAGTVYYHPDRKVAARLAFRTPDGPTELEEAKDFLLDHLLGDFEFDSQSSQTHALALLLLPFVRECIDGPTPMHVIIAPDIGSGKTLLARAALLPGCGFVEATTAPHDDDEWRKRITSELIAGHPAILLDNLSGTLDSASLASALTTGTWRDRMLGSNRTVSLPVRNVWVMTGNNASLTSEQIRRSVPIFIDPQGERPSDRPASEYRHPNLLQWASRNRAKLVNAALTVVLHWVTGPSSLSEDGWTFHYDDSEDPIQSKKTLGSFESWGYTMGGILDSIGMEDFLRNRERLVAENDPEYEERVTFLEAWYYNQEVGQMTHQELCQQVKYPGVLSPVAPTSVAGRNAEDKLRIWLREANNKKLGGFVLRKTPTRPSKWFVEKIGAEVPAVV